MNSKKMKILLADDDFDDCRFFKRAMSELSVTTELEIVNDGEELMEYLEKNSDNLPMALFLDINMPRRNGLECLTEIRKSEKYKDLPVIVFSTSNSWDTINMLFNTGAHVYIHKPNDFAQLKQVIHHAIPLAAEKIFTNKPIKYVLNAPNNENP
jgi:CheY-like chemotaxis protein